MEVDSGFWDKARECAEHIYGCDELLLISHIDADGLTAAGVASQALDRAGVEHTTWFSKQLDEDDLQEIETEGFDTVLFTDFGSGLLTDVVDRDFTPVVADHHQPDGDCRLHLNPLLFDIDGSSELSGAGTAYYLAKALGEIDGVDNRDLASIAVVGAVGDMQDSDGGLSGVNRSVVKDGVDAGVLEAKQDLQLFGRQTRPLPKLFQYSTDVRIPGVSNNQGGARELLEDAGVELKAEDNGDWRRWSDLGDGEKQTVINAAFERCMQNGVPADKIDRLVGETYTLLDEEPGTLLRDASEFSTLLNATARYDEADVGFRVCKGERGETFMEAKELLRTHRRNLREGVQYVADNGVTELENLQYFDAGDEIRDTIVGIIAGMSYNRSAVSRSKPILAFAETDEPGEVKVSSRGTGRLLGKGLDLSVVMSECSSAVGGEGGGHDIAAGAQIPEENVDEFLDLADELVGEQLS